MKSVSILKTCLRVIGLWVGLVGYTFALNLADVKVPTLVTDGQITIGPRTLTLPSEGQWFVLYNRPGTITANETPVGNTLAAYLINLREGKFAASLFIQVPVDSVVASRWSNSPCDVKFPTVFKDDFSSGFRTPKCLLVFSGNQHLTVSATFNRTAVAWLKSKSIDLPGALWGIDYTHYAANEFGILTVYVPEATHTQQEPLVAFGKKMAADLGGFFERRTNQATLAALP